MNTEIDAEAQRLLDLRALENRAIEFFKEFRLAVGGRNRPASVVAKLYGPRLNAFILEFTFLDPKFPSNALLIMDYWERLLKEAGG